MLKKLALFFAIAFPVLLSAQEDISLSYSPQVTIPAVSSTQDQMPKSVDEVIKWNFDVTYECDVATLTITVEQKDGWHIYAQQQPEGGVALPTTFTFNPGPEYSLIGKPKEFGTEQHINEGIPEKYFPGKKAIFKQQIKIKSEKDFKIKFNYSFMACKTACFPPEEREVEILIKGVNPADLPCETDQAVDSTVTGDQASWLTAIAGSCEGFSYSEIFDPVKVKVYKATRTERKVFQLSFDLEIDTLFTMYAFDNTTGYQSAYILNTSDQIESVKDFEVTAVPVYYGETKGYKNKVIIKQEITLKDTTQFPVLTGNLNLYLMGCENNFKTKETIPVSFDLAQAIDNGTNTEENSLFWIFIVAFMSGLVALLTPCVFPMIPMTVTFFTKQSKTKAEGIRKATIYSVSIILIYVLLGVLVASIFGAAALNDLATHPWLNVGFFILFIVFAIAFFGAFEIRLPSSWVNKADRQADKGGLLGIFFMAFTLALVSFSCTGPIVGTVLVQSAEGGIVGPIIAMLGFSVALALPFGMFAAFPGWLNSLPQSGGWLNTVKVTLGFLELAFALKFFSNADLVEQWHLLEREVFIALWIAIFGVLGIYLLGKMQFPHDDEIKKLSVGRGILATLVFAFVIYLIPGLFGAPLKVISGIMPPLTYAESPYGIHGSAPDVEEGWPASTHPHGHGINTIRDYEDALAYAKKVGKPLLLDFTGWACPNCRRMEENVWSHETVSPLMADQFVVASLYVDDREELTGEDIGKLMHDGTKMLTVGDKWKNLQISKYNEMTQPMYVVLDHNENNISGKANYQTHGNPEAFKTWLEFALKQFEASKEATEIKPEFEIVK